MLVTAASILQKRIFYPSLTEYPTSSKSMGKYVLKTDRLGDSNSYKTYSQTDMERSRALDWPG